MPHARRGLKAVEGGAAGGRVSGEVRRRWAADNWEHHALELAKAKRAAVPPP